MSRGIVQVFEQFKEARTQFVQTVAELAVRPQNIEALQNAGVMALLRPLLLDTVPGNCAQLFFLVSVSSPHSCICICFQEFSNQLLLHSVV